MELAITTMQIAPYLSSKYNIILSFNLIFLKTMFFIEILFNGTPFF